MLRFVGYLVTLSAAATASYLPAVETHRLPDPKTVHAIVSVELKKHAGYQSGDLITRAQIRVALSAVAAQTGWKLNVKDHDGLVARGVDDHSFLAKQLTSKEGQAFSRQIARYKLGFDQLDRMSSMPQGRSTVERLVHGPDGYKLLEYMATAKGGHELAKMLGATPRGGNFEAATGKIYDEMQLNAELDKLLKQASRGTVEP